LRNGLIDDAVEFLTDVHVVVSFENRSDFIFD
jgi:hypothetical protein